MSGYPGVTNVTDPAIRAALLALWKKAQALQTAVEATADTALIPGVGIVDVATRRIVNVGTPTALTDAVNLQTLQLYAQTQSVALGTGAILEFGTHAARPAAADRPEGALYWETDRVHLYYITFVSGTKGWTVVEGAGGPMRGTITGPDLKPTDLGTRDAGFVFYSTDFNRPYRWSGTAWADGPGAESRGQIVYFPVSLHADFTPPNGWTLCDGTAGVTRSTPLGTTTTVTVPDLTTANRFLRSVSGATGGTGGSATTHTHDVTPATIEVQAGAGEVVSDDGTFTTSVPSGASGDDALPPYYEARPYMRI